MIRQRALPYPEQCLLSLRHIALQKRQAGVPQSQKYQSGERLAALQKVRGRVKGYSPYDLPPSQNLREDFPPFRNSATLTHSASPLPEFASCRAGFRSGWSGSTFPCRIPTCMACMSLAWRTAPRTAFGFRRVLRHSGIASIIPAFLKSSKLSPEQFLETFFPILKYEYVRRMGMRRKNQVKFIAHEFT